MISSVTRRRAAVALLAVSTACGGSAPSSPSGMTPSPSLQPPTLANPISFPPLEGAYRTFTFARELAYPVREFTRQSPFVLYDNGAFVLQYPPSSIGSGTYRGQYRHADGTLMFLFEFNGRSVDAAWDDATGSLTSDALTIRYHIQMEQSDFENAVYTWVRP